MQKIVVETARYGRVLALEQPEPGATRQYLLHCLDKIVRYTSSTSHALFHAIKELETIQAARKAREDSGSSTDAEAVPPSLNPTRENSGSRMGTTLVPTPTRRRIKKKLSQGLRAHSGLEWFCHASSCSKKKKPTDFANEPNEPARVPSADAAGSAGLAQTRGEPFGVLKHEGKGKRGRPW